MVAEKVTCADAKELLEIYSYYVENTAVSFEYEIPAVEEFNKWYDMIWMEKPIGSHEAFPKEVTFGCYKI